MTCSSKPIDKMDFKAKPKRTVEEEEFKPKKPFSAKANPGQAQPQPQPAATAPADPAAPPGPDNPDVFTPTMPSGPGIQDGPTTYEKLSQAQASLSEGNLEKAAEAATRAIELQPRNRRAYETLAAANRMMRNYKQLAYVADEGLKTFPNDVDLLKNKAFALNKGKDYQSAMETADKALAVNPTDPAAHALKAYALGMTGDTEGMIAELKTAAALDLDFEPLLLAAQKAAPGGEPFVMPGDTREVAVKKQARPKGEGPPLQGLIIFGGMILFLLVILGVLALTMLKKGPEAPPADGTGT